FRNKVVRPSGERGVRADWPCHVGCNPCCRCIACIGWEGLEFGKCRSAPIVCVDCNGIGICSKGGEYFFRATTLVVDNQGTGDSPASRHGVRQAGIQGTLFRGNAVTKSMATQCTAGASGGSTATGNFLPGLCTAKVDHV